MTDKNENLTRVSKKEFTKKINEVLVKQKIQEISTEPTFKTLKSVAIAVGLIDYVNSLTWKSQGNGIYAMRKKS
jgi:hypothetical protein|tara:strand:+ start:273 stop:494 length:222 start_codon:yes stop_codon:yes gene_type:complete